MVKVDFSSLANAMSSTPKQSEPVITEQPVDPAADFLGELYTWLEEDYEELVHDERSPGLHASSLYKLCARREILAALLNMKPVKELQLAGNKFTQDMGHALHQWWQERYLGPKQVLEGNWYCAGCDTTTYGFMPLKCDCGVDWRDAMHYREMRVNIEEFDIVGACDGIIKDLKTGKRRVFEFKTKSTSQYRLIHSPVHDHVIQVHAYMKGLGLDEAIIVYIDKGKQCSWSFRNGVFKAGKPNVKSFLVKFDNSLWDKIISVATEYRRALELLESGSVNSDLDEETRLNILSEFERVCDSPTCNLAKSCQVSEECFSLPAAIQSIEV